MKVTMHQIAEIAGVSKSTVSKVCHNSPEISEETKRTVRQVMKKYGYDVHATRSTRIHSGNHNIGIIIEHPSSYIFTNPFLCEVIIGICEEFSQRGYSISFFWESDMDYSKLYKNKIVEGILLLMPLYNDKRVEALQATGCPIVSIGEHYLKDKIRFINSDDEVGMYKVVEYLYSQNHRKIAFLGGNRNLCSGIQRLEGYKRALKTFNIPYNSQWVKESEVNTQEVGARLMAEILGLKDKPTAIACFNDQIAFGVIQEIKHQYKVPQDFSVIGFDDTQICELVEPRITSVHNIAYEKGNRAARWLADVIEYGDEQVTKRPIILPLDLVLRDSTRMIERKD